jgi:N6-L-threonylcarbamoyladenine synthase
MSALEQPTILAVESSCDETCAAIVRGRQVISNVVASQHEFHAPYGGVVPEIASRHHLESVDAVIEAALDEASLPHDGTGIDAVAATRGPGLIGALLVGLAAAKARAYAWQVPLIGVDHLVGHVASALIDNPELEPPFLCLLVSGGHSMLIDVEEGLDLTLLGTTRDDAAGEAFDKGARLLGLQQPGGPAIQRAAAEGDPTRIVFTPAMVHHDSLDTSFAGIKTALSVRLAESGTGTAQQEPSFVADCAAGYQRAIVQTLAAAVRKALDRSDRRTLAVVGGVAANTELRSELTNLCNARDVNIVAAPFRYCADNAAMIGVAARYHTPLDAADALIVDAIANSPVSSQGKLRPKQYP